MAKPGAQTKRAVIVGIGAGAVVFAAAFPGIGQASPARATAPFLGTAASFAVLGSSTVTNTGSSVITGDLGVSPGTAVVGFPPGVVVGGTIHPGDAVAAQAKNDALTAYNNLFGQPCDQILTGQDLGGKTLTPGVYCFPGTSAQLTGALTLDGQGNPNAVFIFKIGTTLTTASASSVVLINGAEACNVFWQVGSSATLGTTTSFVGTILALASDTLTTGATLDGRAVALNGAVTLDSNHVTASQCAGPPPPTATSTATATSPPTATATATTVPSPTATTPPTATSTVVPSPTPTRIPATATAIATATNTAVAIPTSTATAVATNTEVAAATSTAVPGSTSTPVTHRATATPRPVPRTYPHTGGGGTWVYLQPPRFASASKRTRVGGSSPQTKGLAALPRSGGAAGVTPTAAAAHVNCFQYYGGSAHDAAGRGGC